MGLCNRPDEEEGVPISLVIDMNKSVQFDGSGSKNRLSHAQVVNRNGLGRIYLGIMNQSPRPKISGGENELTLNISLLW